MVRTLARHIVAAGIATADELCVDTLQRRIADEAATAGAVLLPPAIVGAWGTAGGVAAVSG